MEREKKNPFVTRIELDDVKDKLNSRITEVDVKHDKNYSELAKLIALSEKNSEHIVDSTNRLSVSFDNFSKELKDELKTSRQSHHVLYERVNQHDLALSEHNQFITHYSKIAEDKKSHLIKWVTALSAIFVAILAGIFGIVEVIIPILIGGE